MFFEIDEKINTPLYLQVYQRIYEGIKSGQLQALQRLPSIRVLASELNVARGTIELAYQLLVSEGVLESKGAKGTFVAESMKDLPKAFFEQRKTYQSMELTVNQQTLNSKMSNKRKDNSLVVETFDVEPLRLGIPALDAFPMKLWGRISAKVLRESHYNLLSYPAAQGLEELREGLSRYLMVSRGIDCVPEQIFISSGHRASLQLITQSLFNIGDIGWFEEPGYHIAREFLQQMGLELIPISVDKDGMNVEKGRCIAPSANFVIVTPTHQSPTNVVLSLERRLSLLDWANKQNSWIIEDDYDGEFHYQGKPLPALKSLDSQERVIYCGTFSKVLFPALRLSYTVVPSSLVKHFHFVAKKIGNQCPNYQQQLTAQFINKGHFSRHLRKMRNLYRQRRQLLIEAISIILKDIFEVEIQSGGMHIVAKLINGKSAKKYVNLAREYKINIECLSEWTMSRADKPYILLGFTNIKNKQEAIEICERLYFINSKLI